MKKKRTIDRLDALAYAAAERGISYGKLVAMTSKQERDVIAEEAAQKIQAEIKKEKKQKQPTEPPKGRYNICIICGNPVGPRCRYCSACMTKRRNEKRRQGA